VRGGKRREWKNEERERRRARKRKIDEKDSEKGR
jgi:hypothetical protein